MEEQPEELLTDTVYVPIAGAIGSTYTPIQIGTYTVSVSNSSGCSSISFSVDVLNVGVENV